MIAASVRFTFEQRHISPTGALALLDRHLDLEREAIGGLDGGVEF